jgi:hypothetical protein
VNDGPRWFMFASRAKSMARSSGHARGAVVNAILLLSLLASLALGSVVASGRVHSLAVDAAFGACVAVFLTSLMVAVARRVVPALRAESRGRRPRE